MTSIDPEDIHALATEIDQIVDHLDAVAYRYEAFDLERSSQQMEEIADYGIGMAYA